MKSEGEVTQLCLTLSDPMDCSPPGSSVHGMKAIVLEWGAIAFSEIPTAAAAKSRQSCPSLSDPTDYSPLGSSIHGIFPGKSTGGGAIAFSEVIY